MPRKVILGVGVAIPLVAISVWGWWHLRAPDFQNRVYRIGWVISPPFQLRGDDGQPTGLAVDLVREAARRRGIALQWVFRTDSPEAALRSGEVDLWPFLAITPERLKALHISEAFLETEHCMLVRDDSRYRRLQDLAASTIGIADTPVELLRLQQTLPEAHALARPEVAAVIDDVCSQRAQAGFMNAYTGIEALLQDRNCGGHGLRWIPAPQVRTRVGVGAIPAAAGAADAIRSEIGNIAGENKLADILGQWGFISSQQLESMHALLSSRRRETQLLAAAFGFALLFAVACWQTLRVTRERNRTRQAERALREAEQRLRLMAKNLKETVLAFDMDRRLIYTNPAFEALTGYSVSEYKERGFIDWVHPDDRARMYSYWDGIYEGASFHDEEYRMLTKDGRVKWVAASWGPMLDDAGRQIGVQGSERDISDRKQAQEALLESQQRYLQSQKLEGIGRLAGGVAHDFNNLLTVINGYSGMIYRAMKPGDPMRERVDQISRAGARAAELTQQLLTFSRKQVIQPRPLDLNTVVRESERMFQRLLGEDVQLITRLQPGLGLVMADPSQMHQVLMNLVVNARDAMPDGGNVFIETGAVDIDARYAAESPDATPGPAVLLCVTDSGVGMDRETQKHIFEPFFTTKGSQGTGLGLATVYGVVKQSQGWITVYSEAGKGSSFKIYLPQVPSEVGAAEANGAESAAQRGTETVLVVEDQPEVRAFAVTVLEDCGYRVLEAPDGAAAMALSEKHAGRIDMLLTDVVLPGINGRELAERLTAARPELKVLYTSGYSEEVIAHRGVLDFDVAYIAKPYTAEGLATKLRSLL